jgi:pimeloyl-ACP methyl ester carboxylesterase
MSANRVSPWLRLAGVFGLLFVALLAHAQQPTAPAVLAAKGPTMLSVTSKDGTRIAYDRQGSGPALILVGGALSRRVDGNELAALLAPQFTVYTYDRRGRGDSGDTRPYAVQREVEDLDALIDAAGGSAFVYGKSSGAALSLQAAAALGGKVKKLALYEAPYNDTDGAAAEWKAIRTRVEGLLAADRRADAIAGMKASPAWPGMVAMAPTLAYDNAILGEDRAVPVSTAARVKVPTLVMDGGASAGPMPYMRATADAIAKAMPHAQRRTLPGQAHDASAEALAPVLRAFFQ